MGGGNSRSTPSPSPPFNGASDWFRWCCSFFRSMSPFINRGIFYSWETIWNGNYTPCRQDISDSEWDTWGDYKVMRNTIHSTDTEAVEPEKPQLPNKWPHLPYGSHVLLRIQPPTDGGEYIFNSLPLDIIHDPWHSLVVLGSLRQEVVTSDLLLSPCSVCYELSSPRGF